jgi:hypothetical protein
MRVVAMFSLGQNKKRLSTAIGRLLNLTTAYKVVREYEERVENCGGGVLMVVG